MNITAQNPFGWADALQGDFAAARAQRSVRQPISYAARSISNIASWNAYLAEDCVKAMIKLGWDRTT